MRVCQSTSVSKNDIVRRLCDMLDSANVSCRECVVCGWIDYADAKTWFPCAQCDNRVCETCFDDAEDSVDDSENSATLPKRKQQADLVCGSECADARRIVVRGSGV